MDPGFHLHETLRSKTLSMDTITFFKLLLCSALWWLQNIYLVFFLIAKCVVKCGARFAKHTFPKNVQSVICSVEHGFLWWLRQTLLQNIRAPGIFLIAKCIVKCGARFAKHTFFKNMQSVFWSVEQGFHLYEMLRTRTLSMDTSLKNSCTPLYDDCRTYLWDFLIAKCVVMCGARFAKHFSKTCGVCFEVWSTDSICMNLRSKYGDWSVSDKIRNAPLCENCKTPYISPKRAKCVLKCRARLAKQTFWKKQQMKYVLKCGVWIQSAWNAAVQVWNGFQVWSPSSKFCFCKRSSKHTPHVSEKRRIHSCHNTVRNRSMQMLSNLNCM